jgi:hypothetical protein
MNESHQSAVADETAGFCCSHAVRLSGREWIAVLAFLVALLCLVPAAWRRIEPFDPGDDYRLPYELSNDYWHYRRYCRRACAQQRIPVIGDSVVWGHYVAPDETLSHYLNESAGSSRFANLGLDGTHPAALNGLVRHYAGAIQGRPVVLHFNPLWMTSKKHDLQTAKEFHFNHPTLVPQFHPRIPCYHAPFSTRMWVVAEQRVPFLGWTSHLRCAYWQSMSLHAWTLQHPYANPLAPVRAGLRQPQSSGEQVPQRPDGQMRKRDLAWVELEESLQWRFFRLSLEHLKKRNGAVFVLVGPFNEHVLGDTDVARYGKIKHGIGTWLSDRNIPHFIAPALPPELYADTSHPIADGYALLARQLLNDTSFAAWASLPSLDTQLNTGN